MAYQDSELSDWGKDNDPPVQPLTREEAQALFARHPSMSVWRLIAAQALFGVLVALVWGVLSRSQVAALSALYGAAVIVIPSALMAQGIVGRRAGRSVGGLVLWELVKLVLTGAMLVTAPQWVKPLDWPALLVTLVLCLKVYGVVLFLEQRRQKKSS